MPMNRSLYPSNWKWIALAVKEDADWRCEWCGRPCRMPQEPVEDLVKRLDGSKTDRGWLKQLFETVWSEEFGEVTVPKLGRFVLTVAHLNHIPSDCSPENLKALCAPCHCRYDMQQMATKKRVKRELLGQLTLPVR